MLEKDKTIKVFVYGTLMRGNSNHRLLESIIQTCLYVIM